MNKQTYVQALMCLALVALLAALGSAQEKNVTVQLSDLVQNVGGGQIDWGKQMMYASASAPIPSEDKVSNRARAYLKARDYAKMLAIANLLLVVQNATVTYEGSGKDMMDKDASLYRKIEGYVNNVEIISDQMIKDDTGGGAVKVTVGTRIYGDKTPGTAFLEKLADTEKPKQPPLIEIPEEISVRVQVRVSKAPWDVPWIAASRPVDPNADQSVAVMQSPYSSLVVDARGFFVPHAISPKIRKLNGDQVYGSLLAKTDPAIRQGTVAYARTPDAARESDRCGDNPLVVTAVGRGGGKSMCDLIVQDNAAQTILTENQVSKFLDAYKVIFVVDPPGSALRTLTSETPDAVPTQEACATFPALAASY